jgi:hypothetical protein
MDGIRHFFAAVTTTVAEITNKKLTEETQINDHHLELQSEAPVRALLLRDDEPIMSHNEKVSVWPTRKEESKNRKRETKRVLAKKRLH